MQVKAIYNKGKLEFSESIHLRHKRFPVQVILPDEVIETEKETGINSPAKSDEKVSRPHIQAMLDDLDTILNTPLPPDDNLPELTEKQKDRIAAFELRSQYRQEQGRPA